MHLNPRQTGAQCQDRQRHCDPRPCGNNSPLWPPVWSPWLSPHLLRLFHHLQHLLPAFMHSSAFSTLKNPSKSSLPKVSPQASHAVSGTGLHSQRILKKRFNDERPIHTLPCVWLSTQALIFFRLSSAAFTKSTGSREA